MVQRTQWSTKRRKIALDLVQERIGGERKTSMNGMDYLVVDEYFSIVYYPFDNKYSVFDGWGDRNKKQIRKDFNHHKQVIEYINNMKERSNV